MDIEKTYFCDFCTEIKNKAKHVFKTPTGKEAYCCEQHANIALTCMQHLRALDTNTNNNVPRGT